jgi:hypothetical protein
MLLPARYACNSGRNQEDQLRSPCIQVVFIKGISLPATTPVDFRGGLVLAKYTVILAAGFLAASAFAAGAQTTGDWVLGNYKGAGYWFPGVIDRVQGGQVTIRYDDGDKETVALRDVRPYNWSIGKKVECNYKGQGEWYRGTISSLAGERIGIAYDDGDKETTKTGRCRSR